ncbi:RNase adapter RapZ [Thermodesulfobium sp.]|jgi:UPF0042 nucleotide-binding protein
MNAGPWLIILTGLSGAGKSQALHVLEDLGFFCIDNLPPFLLPELTRFSFSPKFPISRMAVVIDIRGKTLFPDLQNILKKIKEQPINITTLFLEASDEVLIRRFSETRRRHPLSQEGGYLSAGIIKERELLSPIREMSDIVIDTSYMKVNQLKERLRTYFTTEGEQTFNTTLLSFGFKYGIPMDADMIIDVRFLPNPFYEEHLKNLTGMDAPVEDFILSQEVTKNFLKVLDQYLLFFLPKCMEEGKSNVTIAIGCTGGEHRSVTIVRELARKYRNLGFKIFEWHRDLKIGRNN